MSLYDRLGGEPTFTAAVPRFYARMLTDARVARFFDEVDMAGQALKQQAFLTFISGGPVNYSGKDMREAHEHLHELGLDDSHVDVVLEHLATTLAGLGASAEDLAQVVALANSLRDDVLNR